MTSIVAMWDLSHASSAYVYKDSNKRNINFFLVYYGKKGNYKLPSLPL